MLTGVGRGTVHAIMVVATISGGCREANDLQVLARLATSDGATLADQCLGADTTALLLYRPADCVNCYSVVADWLQWVEAPDRDARLILTEPPTDAQEVQLASYGLATDIRIVDRLPSLLLDGPVTAMCLSGELRAYSTVRPDSDPLLWGWNLDAQLPPNLHSIREETK